MRFATEKSTWYIPGGILVLWLLLKGGRRGQLLVLFLILGVVISDQFTSGLMKPWFERMRPCKALSGFRLLDHCGSLYGFPSSHAANSAVVATLGALILKRCKFVWAALAALIGYSRIYVGVHYPGDVLVGWIVGILIAVGLLYAYRYVADRYALS